MSRLSTAVESAREDLQVNEDQDGHSTDSDSSDDDSNGGTGSGIFPQAGCYNLANPMTEAVDDSNHDSSDCEDSDDGSVHGFARNEDGVLELIEGDTAVPPNTTTVNTSSEHCVDDHTHNEDDDPFVPELLEDFVTSHAFARIPNRHKKYSSEAVGQDQGWVLIKPARITGRILGFLASFLCEYIMGDCLDTKYIIRLVVFGIVTNLHV